MPNLPLSTTLSAMSALTLTDSNGHSNGSGNGASIVQDPIVEAWERYKILKQSEDSKNKLIEELIFRYEYVTAQCKKAEEELRRDQQFYHNFHAAKAQLEADNNHLREAIMRDPFVLVLLDGDGMIFHDQLLNDAKNGGRQAANLLHDSTKKFVAELLEGQALPPNIRIVSRMYANLEGLANTCHKAGIVPSMEHIVEFTRGFTSGQVLFDFIDVGSGKDRADEKISETLKTHVNDVHCLQIFFGCSHDNGHTRLLEKYMYDNEARGKITLLEGVPFEKELEALMATSPFQRAKFGNLFREKKIVLGQTQLPSWTALNETTLRSVNGGGNGNGTSMSSPLTRVQSPADSLSSRTNSVVINSYASRAAKAPETPETPPSSTRMKPASPAISSAKATSSTTVPRNRKGQRVDADIPKYDKPEVDRVKKMKMCNVHYLRNECPYGDKCTHKHDYKPNKYDIEWLKVVARMAACRFGAACDDAKCIYGHRCQAPERMDKSKFTKDGGKTCIFGTECVFPPEMHNMDCVVVRTFKV
ncbi:hypothetical protein EJ08DRAFT_21593 [Tothia fuscella]|uniref:C3H1-type domain-containing protein n=1 Tax=Tothia fuscella TaxID=1048955 RepID=A0A9P4NYK0_9PEZI|nr:hypothetical protein EJ08DRAFT_21593 [Tothia fuscella]